MKSKQLNEDFENICGWFSDNKLSINFVEARLNLLFLQVNKDQRMSVNWLLDIII